MRGLKVRVQQSDLWVAIMRAVGANATPLPFGEVGGGVLTVRFTYRSGVIRIFGAGYWRKGREIYERENQIHR
jgi:hypothetical protein